MNPGEISESLSRALWNIENYISFHADEEHRDGFPRVRVALAKAWQVTQALVPPVVLLQEVREVPVEEHFETLMTNVRSTGERSVSSISLAMPCEEPRRVPARVWTGRPLHPPTSNYEFPPEALPSWTRIERALKYTVCLDVIYLLRLRMRIYIQMDRKRPT